MDDCRRRISPFFLMLISTLMLAGCKLPAPRVIPPTYTRAPTFTPLPSYTPQPTYTQPPTYTPYPTYTPAALFFPDITVTPSPTKQPGVLVRIRNMTSGPVNLSRYGRSGELHFLGWLNPTFYGEFRFPDLGEWMIQYCRRDRDGNSFDCVDKRIVVTADGQEFIVP